jgi:hypothetical protein
MSKRYLLFTGRNYYPGGGWEDFVAAFDEYAAAVAEGQAQTTYGTNCCANSDWYQVVDLHTLREALNNE